MTNLINRRILLASSLGVLAASCAHAQNRALPAAGAIDDEELSRMLDFRISRQRAANAAIVATLSSSSRHFQTARFSGVKGNYPLGGDTIFEIASLTKIFTALLLGVEVVEGRMKVKDPLQDYLPYGVTAPSFEGRPITLLDLATHGSALPLRPNNLVNPAADAPDKYAGYTLDQLYRGLPDYQLSYAPGSRFQYSNLAFALLGQAIARRENMNYADVLQKRVINPLGLSDTSLVEDPNKAARRAQGYGLYLEPVSPGGESALSPAYGLRSTADDLLTFLDLFLNDRGPIDLVKAAHLMLTIDRPGENDTTRMALGWRRTVVHGETFYWSNGSADDARTFMGFNSTRRLGVVALADAASGGGLDDIGMKVLDPQQEFDAKIVPAPQFIDLPEEILLRAT
ncbi:MAG: serine hydrolase, partial [Parvularculaceae bacterium]